MAPDYTVVYGDSLPKLEEAVVEKLRLGYVPAGGITSDDTDWIQALWRPATTKIDIGEHTS